MLALKNKILHSTPVPVRIEMQKKKIIINETRNRTKTDIHNIQWMTRWMVQSILLFTFWLATKVSILIIRIFCTKTDAIRFANRNICTYVPKMTTIVNWIILFISNHDCCSSVKCEQMFVLSLLMIGKKILLI